MGENQLNSPPPFKAEDYLEKEAHSVLCIMYLCFILIY